MTSWFGELARRRVFQAIAVYVALAWGFTEIFTTVSETLIWPAWTRTAVVVLFIFVIMLIGPSAQESTKTKWLTLRIGVASLMAMVGTTIAFGISQVERPYVNIDPCPDTVAECGQFGGVDALGDAIFRQSAVPFELVSVLLLVAIIAAVAVARGHTPAEKEAFEKRREAAKGEGS